MAKNRIVSSAIRSRSGNWYSVTPCKTTEACDGLLVSADGAALGSPFQISKGTSGVDVTYGAGVFMVAHTDSGVLTLTPITPQGKLLTDSRPYPAYPNHTQTVPAIAFDGANFLVVWENLDTERCTHVSAGRLDGLGRAIDVEVTLVSSVPDTDEDVDVAFDGTNYVIAWFNRPIQPYLDEGTIRVARVSTDGILLDGPATMGGRVVSATDSPRKRPRIARLGSQTMVVWEIGPLQSGLLAYRIVGTRISIDGTALDTATGSEGLWLSALMEGMSPQPMVPEIAFGGDRSLMVNVS